MRLEFEPKGFDHIQYWLETDWRKAKKIFEIIAATKKSPFEGIGKPEPLKHEFSGCWSRRIDGENRLVYRVSDDILIIMSCRYHYD